MDGEEIQFLESEGFVSFLKLSIANRAVTTASVFAVNALIPATSVSALHPDCNAEDLVPLLAKIVFCMLGSSGMVLRVGPGILVCIHLAPRSVDPELLGLQIERSIKRIFNIPVTEQDFLKGTFSFDPSDSEAEEALRHFLSNL
jgi:hypothetical protein